MNSSEWRLGAYQRSSYTLRCRQSMGTQRSQWSTWVLPWMANCRLSPSPKQKISLCESISTGKCVLPTKKGCCCKRIPKFSVQRLRWEYRSDLKHSRIFPFFIYLFIFFFHDFPGVCQIIVVCYNSNFVWLCFHVQPKTNKWLIVRSDCYLRNRFV